MPFEVHAQRANISFTSLYPHPCPYLIRTWFINSSSSLNRVFVFVCQKYFPSRLRTSFTPPIDWRARQKAWTKTKPTSYFRLVSSLPPPRISSTCYFTIRWTLINIVTTKKVFVFFIFPRYKFAIDTFAPYTSPRQYLHAFVKRVKTVLRLSYPFTSLLRVRRRQRGRRRSWFFIYSLSFHTKNVLFFFSYAEQENFFPPSPRFLPLHRRIQHDSRPQFPLLFPVRRWPDRTTTHILSTLWHSILSLLSSSLQSVDFELYFTYVAMRFIRNPTTHTNVLDVYTGINVIVRSIPLIIKLSYSIINISIPATKKFATQFSNFSEWSFQ